MFENCLMHQCHTRCEWANNISATVPKKVQNWKVRGRNCLNLVTIGHSISHDQVSSAERSAKLRRLGGDGRITNEQQVDEIGGSRRSDAMYSRAGFRGICDAAR